MKKCYKLIVILLSLLLCFTFVYVKADSGWDTDYDYDFDYDYDYDYDYDFDYDYDYDYDDDDYSYSGSGSYNGNYDVDIDSDSFELIAFLLFAFFVFYFIYTYNKKPKHITSPVNNSNVTVKTLNSYDKYKNIVPYDELIIKKSLPHFSKKEFLDKVYNDFIKLQNAWMNFNYNEMKPLLSDELFNTYKSQLKVLELKKQKNIMRDFTHHSCEIVDFSNENGISTIKVILMISFFDYVVDQNNRIVRGNNRYRVKNKYELIYVMKNKKSISGKCPGCGADLENSQASICPYCRMKITNNNHDWVLSKKSVISRF